MDIAMLRVLGRTITYTNSTGMSNAVYFAPYEDTLYICRVCQQEFAAWQENLLYQEVREVRKSKRCPTCHTPLWQSLVEQKRIPWRDVDRESFDNAMRAQGYSIITADDETTREYPELFDLPD